MSENRGENAVTVRYRKLKYRARLRQQSARNGTQDLT